MNKPMDRLQDIYNRALALQPLSLEDGMALWSKAHLDELMAIAYYVRHLHLPGRVVTWQIDRNINITNECVSACSFCNFHAGAGHTSRFTTTEQEYVDKVDELYRLGGDQILLQGGLAPQWPLARYEELFRFLRSRYPELRIHALGPPEIVYIAQREGLTVETVLRRLVEAGLSSLPGAGAEILVDRVRQKVSPRKATVAEWLGVMRIAQELGLVTSATMMYGHVETVEERIEHLLRIREAQEARPSHSQGFLAFIAWPFQSSGTALARQANIPAVPMQEHLRMVALARLMLHNIKHIQASWLTVGIDTAKLSLYAGADDMGSIMIEEKVVASAGATRTLDAVGMQRAILQVGFIPQLRDQAYNAREFPAGVSRLRSLD